MDHGIYRHGSFRHIQATTDSCSLILSFGGNSVIIAEALSFLCILLTSADMVPDHHGKLCYQFADLVETTHTGLQAEVFDSLDELRKYTIDNAKYFPKESAYAGGVLKYLLREILHARHTGLRGREGYSSM